MARIESLRTVGGRGLAPWQSALALRTLESDLRRDIPVSRLASLCGLSRGHFTKAFKISTGLPPHRWLTRRRIRRAQELLEGTDDTISVIALSCGFADQSHLTRMFHAEIGLSPAAWRRRRKAGAEPVDKPGL